MAELGAVVDEELQGGLAIGTVLGDIGLDLAGARAADSLRIGRVGLVARCHQLRTPLGIPSIPSNIPDDLENTGRGLHSSGSHDVSQSHNGNGKDGLVEEHDERMEIRDWEIGSDERIGFKIAQRVWSKRMCWAKERLLESVEKWKTKSDEVVRKIRSRPEENGGKERNRATAVSSQYGSHDGGQGLLRYINRLTEMYPYYDMLSIKGTLQYLLF